MSFWKSQRSTHVLMSDDGKTIELMLIYDRVLRMWTWRPYATAQPWHDMPNVKGRKEAQAVALATWRMS